MLLCQYYLIGIDKMNINELVAKRIKAVRKFKNLTAEKLAWTANLSKSCVSYAEKGNNSIKISTINAMCNAMDITLAEFFSVFDENISS